MANPNGRPEKPIDWDEVDKLLLCDCTGTEVAARLGVYPDTLYNRCQKEKGMIFSTYSAEKKAKGDLLLKEKQVEKALAGDNTMLVWLGKCRLKQREYKPDNEQSDLALMAKILEMSQNKTRDPLAPSEGTNADTILH